MITVNMYVIPYIIFFILFLSGTISVIYIYMQIKIIIKLFEHLNLSFGINIWLYNIPLQTKRASHHYKNNNW